MVGWLVAFLLFILMSDFSFSFQNLFVCQAKVTVWIYLIYFLTLDHSFKEN